MTIQSVIVFAWFGFLGLPSLKPVRFFTVTITILSFEYEFRSTGFRTIAPAGQGLTSRKVKPPSSVNASFLPLTLLQSALRNSRAPYSSSLPFHS